MDERITHVKQHIEDVIIQQLVWDSSIEEELEELLELARNRKDAAVEGFCHANLARYYYMRSDAKLCNEQLKIGLPILQTSGDQESLAMCYNLLGVDAMNHGNYHIAMDYYLEVIHCCDPISRRVGSAYINIGHIFYEIGDLKQAVDYCRKGQDICEKVGAIYNLPLALAQESIYQSTMGNTSEALAVIERLEDIIQKYEMFDSIEHQTDLHEAKFFYYNAIGDETKREQAMDMFIESIDEEDRIFDLVEDFIWICRALMAQNSLTRVPELLKLVRRVVVDCNIKHLMMELLETELEYYSHIGATEKCVELRKEFYEVSVAKKADDIETYRFNVELRISMEALHKKQLAMENENRRLLQLASTDALTGISNRALFNQKSEELFDKAKAEHRNYAVEMLDVDFFKEYNDTYGHQKGDEVLQQIGQVLNGLSSEQIFVARYGGDEFVIIYYDMTDDEILEKANWIKEQIAQKQICHKSSSVSDVVTISQGIRNSDIKSQNRLWDFMTSADYALYHVKKNGKGDIHLIHKMVYDEDALAEGMNDSNNIA